MSTTGLPTIWELVAEGSATLPEPFSRAALINWISARRPDVGVSSIAAHIQFATANAGNPGHHNPFAGREPLLHRMGRGQYLRYRASADDGSTGTVVPSGRVVLIGSSGAVAAAPLPAAQLFESAGFARAREFAAGSGHPWFVLTAKHGLLDPDDVVAPFDVQLGDQSMGYRNAWGSGWSRSWATGCCWRASPSRCTAASTSRSRCGIPWRGGVRRWTSSCPTPGRSDRLRDRTSRTSPSRRRGRGLRSAGCSASCPATSPGRPRWAEQTRSGSGLDLRGCARAYGWTEVDG